MIDMRSLTDAELVAATFGLAGDPDEHEYTCKRCKRTFTERTNRKWRYCPDCRELDDKKEPTQTREATGVVQGRIWYTRRRK